MVFAFLLALEPGVGAQSPIGSPVRPQVLNNDPNQSPDPSMTKLEKEAEKQRNLKRQQDIRRDSEKLLQLATELKQYVDKTNENIISLDVIRKAEQIEKLAKNVKEKMKQ
jgi:predicted RNA-binding protein with RPS1 domain